MATPPFIDNPLDYYHRLPKVDLHRHLEGSLRMSTLREVSREINLQVKDTRELSGMVQVGPGEELNIVNFLMKFETLRKFYRSQEIIERITLEAIQDAAEDNVRYLELRFTPVALARVESFTLGEVMDWVVNSARLAENMFQITTRLIVSFNRHEDLESARQVIQLAAERIDRGIVGLDMAGNEAQFSGRKFWDLIRLARESGLRLTVHAGEWGEPQNVQDAILHLGADRIGHGIRVMEDAHIVALARERGIPFEVCLTSNYQTGVVASYSVHPLLHMLQAGLTVTLNTDDPSICQVQLSDEYRLACEQVLHSREPLKSMILSAAQAAFLPQPEKSSLVKDITQELIKVQS